jgi:hypothetical protein
MSYIQLSKISPDIQEVALPGQAAMGYKLSGTKGIPVDVFFELNNDNNIYFLSENNNLVKEISKTFVLSGGDMKFDELVSLVKVNAASPEEDFDYCFIYVQVVNKINNLGDIKHCMVRFL